MYINSFQIKTRYSETDQMGIIYHANYIIYYECARTEAMRSLGCSYSEMENEGIMMPIIEVQGSYLKPAYYDEELTIKTIVKDLPTSRIVFYYEIYNSQQVLINKGTTTLAFMHATSRRPCRPPEKLMEALRKYF